MTGAQLLLLALVAAGASSCEGFAPHSPLGGPRALPALGSALGRGGAPLNAPSSPRLHRPSPGRAHSVLPLLMASSVEGAQKEGTWRGKLSGVPLLMRAWLRAADALSSALVRRRSVARRGASRVAVTLAQALLVAQIFFVGLCGFGGVGSARAFPGGTAPERMQAYSRRHDAPEGSGGGSRLQFVRNLESRDPKKIAAGVLQISGGVLLVLPIASRAVRLAGKLVKKATAPKDCITITLVQVVLTGEEADKMKESLRDLSFKRDELADRMRWAIRHDVTIKNAQLALEEGAEDTLGESAIARQAARYLLGAKQRGGWVAGKVDCQSFLFWQTADAQQEFFTQCSKVRATMSRVAKVAASRSDSVDVGMINLRGQTDRIQRALDEQERTLAALAEDTRQEPLKPAEDLPGAVGGSDRKYFITTVVTATIGALGLAPDAQNSELYSLKTPQTLHEMQRLTDENLLSLEVLWAPEGDGPGMSKDDVMASLEAPRASGYASVQSLDLYGMSMQ